MYMMTGMKSATATHAPSPEERPFADIPSCDLETAFNNCFQTRNFVQALDIVCELLARDPHNEFHKKRAGIIVPEIEIAGYTPLLKQTLSACLDSLTIAHQPFFRAWLTTFWEDPLQEPLTSLMEEEKYEDFAKRVHWETLRPCLRDPFLLLGLRTLIMTDTVMEDLLTWLRRWSLENQEILEDEDLPFLCALAEYAYQREYALLETEEEAKAVDSLASKAGKNAPALTLALLGCYRPLHNFLTDAPETKALRNLITLQVTEPLTERALRKTIPALTSVENTVSQDVQAMYEQNPYPQWRSFDTAPLVHTEVEADILVAGCGTGWFAIQIALAFPNAKLTAVDLSLTSLSYAKRKAREMGALNISFGQADILKLDQMEDTFDLIECSGVLHHMKNPEAGWASLLTRLKPGGRMFIALYSETGRKSIVEARSHIAQEDYTPDIHGIRRFRKDIMALPYDHPLYEISEYKDFYNLSDCRDLVFHIQEKRYTLPELKTQMDALGLSFLGFREQPKQIQNSYIKDFPEDESMTDMDNWGKFEEKHPHLFKKMYQFACCRKGETDTPSAGFQNIDAVPHFTIGRQA